MHSLSDHVEARVGDRRPTPGTPARATPAVQISGAALVAAEHQRHQAEMATVQAMIGQLEATQRAQLATLTAPVAGTVQQLALHTEGGVVTEAQALMVIVPDAASVSAEVTLENKDIGFVTPGQDAAIKLETFPFTRYGTVKATVHKVTQDAVNDEKRGALVPASLKLEQTTMDVDGQAIKLAPGMNITAEIKTGQRRVIEYLPSPIQSIDARLRDTSAKKSTG